MGYKLSIYSSRAFKEYLLPAVNNANYSVHMSHKVFPFLPEEELELEVINHCWRFRDTDKYQILNTVSEENYIGRDLKDQDLMSVIFHSGEKVTVQFIETAQAFAAFSKYDIRNMETITIGRLADNDISYSGSNLVKRQQHAVLRRKDNYWILEDHSDNGIFVNSIGINGSKQLEFGDCINIFGLYIVFLNGRIAVNDYLDTVCVNNADMSLIQKQADNKGETFVSSELEKIHFHRSPRQIYKIDSDPIEIDAPPQLKQEVRKPLLLTIGPSMTMAIPMFLGSGMAILSTRMSSGTGSAFMYTGLITAFSSAVIGVGWALANIHYEKKRNKEEELHRFEAYGEYLIKCSNTIKEKYDRNTEHMKKMYPDAVSCCEYNENTACLWNRNSSHEDYLTYRLGIGNIPFQAPIHVPKERFTMINDSLSERPMMIKKSFEILKDVPACIDLMKHKLVGIVGGKGKQGARDILYNLVAQAAVSNCYTDLKMVFIYDEKEDEDGTFRFAKWLPHVWSEDKKTRFVAANKNEASDILYELTNVLRIRLENADSLRKKEIPKPYYLLLAVNPELLEGELISSYIFKNDENVGLTTVMLVENYEELPNSCNYIIENDSEFRGMYAVTDNLEERIAIQYDNITEKQLEWLARTLSRIEVNEDEKGGEMPSSLSFFEMYGINHLEELHVADRWRKNRTYESMKALVGQKAGGVDCYLDVHEKYHGPHGLVAGTTGSGKSETLQTYLLSLAINFSPDDVGFFLIDYKGGGMANLFDGLPHVIGQISNLSGNQVRRAMVSIKSENKRRQRIFNEHGVNNINLYTRLYKNNEASVPVPHMFIVIDEFAELKREEPEFMKELISVAQVGRSLGVHLILATQKPSGTVDDNIWSNSKFRLCLRVQDRQDSNDMLHRPDAAYITQAGRGYLQVGNDELFELFQSGYSGAAYDEDSGEVKTDIAFMINTTGKAALVGNHLKMQHKNQVKQNWISTLLQTIVVVMQKGNMQLKELLSDSTLAGFAIKQIFGRIAEQGIDYPENEYNAKRIHDLLEAYESVGVGSEVSEDAKKVIAYSEKHRLKLPEMKEKTQLDAIVEYLYKIAEENGYDNNLTLWLPVLPTALYLTQLKSYHCNFDGTGWESRSEKWHLQVPVGLYDDPVNQAQNPLVIDFAENGHHAVIGVAGSGKSTFLQTLLYALVCKYTPSELNIYALDFSAKMLDSYRNMPHVGGVAYEGEEEKISKFFTMIKGILAERKKLFQGGNYSQYVRVHGVELPAILIVIDNYAAFRNKSAQDYDETIMQLVKEGGSCGIFMIMTAGGFGSLEIPTRVADNIRTTLSLEMSDKFQYSEVMRMTHLEVLPEVNVKGRGLAKVGDDVLEYQTAMAFEAEDDFKRMESIAELADKMRKAWKGKCARPIPEIPEKPVWEEFSQLDEVEQMAKGDRFLPVGYNAQDASIYGIDLSTVYCYLITGKARTGKTNFLKLAAAAAVMRGGEVTLIDFGNDLALLAQKLGKEVIDTDQKLYDFFQSITPDVVSRNKRKKAAEVKGMADEEIYMQQLQYQSRFIMIADLADFVNHVTKPSEGVGEMSGFVENLLDKGMLHNIFWMACHEEENHGRVMGRKVYELFIRDRRGIHFGGNVMSHRFMDFENLSFQEKNRSLKPGLGMLPANDESADKVVIPLYK